MVVGLRCNENSKGGGEAMTPRESLRIEVVWSWDWEL